MTGKIHVVSRKMNHAPYPPGEVIYVGRRVAVGRIGKVIAEASALGNVVYTVDKFRPYLWREYNRASSPVRAEIDRIYQLVASGQDVCLQCWCHDSPDRGGGEFEHCHADVIRALLRYLLSQRRIAA